MSTINLKLPASLHKQLRDLARGEGISVNQFIATAVSEKMAALLTDQYLGGRAKRGSRGKFDRVLSKVKPADPIPGD